MHRQLGDEGGSRRLAMESSGRMRARETEQERAASAREAKEVSASGSGTGSHAEKWKRKRWQRLENRSVRLGRERKRCDTAIAHTPHAALPLAHKQ
jgi:hypothetical protein